MIGHTLKTNRFAGWFAALRVTKVNALTEMQTVQDASDFDAFNVVEHLRNSPGLLAWGKSDDCVVGSLSKQLAALIGGPNLFAKE
jgi:hypothetical protein